MKYEDAEKTSFETTPLFRKYGNHEFLVMPMGLCKAPATFQSLANSIFGDVIDVFIVIYLDDLLAYGKTYDEHCEELELVLSRLIDNELYVGKSKYKRFTKQTEFWGFNKEYMALASKNNEK